MSKYTNAQLKQMALDLKAAYHSFDPRFDQFVMAMMVITASTEQEVLDKIEEFVNLPED